MQITTPTSSRVVEICGIVLPEPELVIVHKRLHLENRPTLKPGVVCLGTITKGQRKYVCSPFPIQHKETIPKGQWYDDLSMLFRYSGIVRENTLAQGIF